MIIVLLICLVQSAFSQDFKLTKRTYEINDSQSFTFEETPDSLPVKYDQSFLINDTNEFYFFKDVYNNINVTLQNITDLEMYIDLTGPWSWYKSTQCLYYYQYDLSLENYEPPECTDIEFNKSLQIDGDNNETSNLRSDTQQIKGYRRNSNISIGNVSVELTVLEVNEIVSPLIQMADGGLSLTVFNSSFNHSFMNAFLNQSSNNLVQFKGTEISFFNQIPNNTQIVKINNLNNTHQWRFNVKNISLYNKVKTQDTSATAILSLNTQFILLPKNLLDIVQKSLIFENPSTKCQYVDENLYALKCNNLIENQLENLNLTLIIDNQNFTIKHQSLIKSCQNTIHGQQDCIFNIRLSTSQFIILGEPFFKDNKIVLDFKESSLGCIRDIQTITQTPQDLEFSRMQQWIFGLTLLFVLAFCLLNVKHVYKWIVRAIKYRKAVNTEDEQQLRNKEVEIGEMEKAEQMTQSIEENSI